MATELNIEIDQGATWVKQMLWQDHDTNAYDLSGHIARMQVRKNYADLDKSLPLVELTNENGIVLGDGTGDYNIVITLSDSETANIPLGQYFYDLELEDETTVTKLLRGKFFVLGEVTR